MATPVRNALANTIIGSAARDALTGTSGGDLIFGYGASGSGLPPPPDPAGGGAGDNDTLSGVDGDDTIFGGGGNDTVRGGRGADLIFGDDGADFLSGDDGRDIVSGGAGNDRIFGGWNEDSLSGDAGDDTISGGGLNDRIAGGAGDDTLDGGAGDDEIDGGAGDDEIIGGAGDDIIEGGDGVDTAQFSGYVLDEFGRLTPGHEITLSSGVITVTDRFPDIDGNEGTDSLIGIERLQFGDRLATVPAPANSIDLAVLTPEQGFVVEIDDTRINYLLGASVTSAGDFNGDGLDDVLIGSFVYALDPGAGSAYVIYGTTEKPVSDINVNMLDPDLGFKIQGAEPLAGRDVSTAGDVNGDGLDDVIIGASHSFSVGDSRVFAGEAYVIYGTEETIEGGIFTNALTPELGATLYGPHLNAFVGSQISAAGDMNGDGIDDLFIGSEADDNYSDTYVLFGSVAGLDPVIDLAAITPAQGFFASDVSSLTRLGDVNGDGIDDLTAVAPDSSRTRYIIFGREEGFPDGIDLTTVTPEQGFAIENSGESFPFGVNALGDVNGDGIDDFAASGPRDGPDGTRPGAGESYVVFGRDDGFGAGIDLATLAPSQGFAIHGAEAGDAVETARHAGDLNGDGFDDMVLSSSGADSLGNLRTDAGEVYVIFGSAQGLYAGLDLAALSDAQGLVIYHAEGNRYGGPMSAAGDVNGDGFDDLVLGAPRAERIEGDFNPYYIGKSYVIYGREFNGGSAGASVNAGNDAAGAINSRVTLSASDVLEPPGGTTALESSGPADAGSAVGMAAYRPAAPPDPGPLMVESETAALAS